MQRRSIAALMISLLLLSACGHGAGERSFQTSAIRSREALSP